MKTSKYVLKFMLALGCCLGVLALASCIDYDAYSEKYPEDEPETVILPVRQVNHFVTQDGLECVSIKPRFNDAPEGISCNWPEYIYKRNNNLL